MNLTHIVVFSALAGLFGLTFSIGALRARPFMQPLRHWVMLVASVVALYWLQTSTPIRNLDFWLPTASLGLTIVVWAATQVPTSATQAPTTQAQPVSKPAPKATPVDVPGTLVTLAVIATVVAALALMRYVPALCCVTPSRPPDILAVLIGLALIAGLAFGSNALFPRLPRLLNLAVIAIIALFVILKLDALAQGVSAGLRVLTGQATDQASGLDLRWLGFSYIAFRLMHVLRDRATGRLAPGALSLREFVSYVLFFPALTAGPIDRAERFVKDYRNPAAPQLVDVLEGGRRIITGVFKKFVLADLLAIVALNGANALQTQSTLWMWVLVYAYALRIYFDFSGYTDVAIGLGRCFGIKLPENFERPYLKSNLTQFWNSWHITLAQWFRAYFFNPVTRALRTRKLPGGKAFTPSAIIFIGQTGTMLLIGL